MCLHLSQFCSEHQIILIALHANATHIIQPLDVALFKALKPKWYKTYEDFSKNAFCVGIQKFQVAPLLKKTFDSMNLPKILQNGFKKCGLYPFNVNAIDYPKVIQTTKNLSDVQPQESENIQNSTQNVSLEVFDTKISDTRPDTCFYIKYKFYMERYNKR